MHFHATPDAPPRMAGPLIPSSQTAINLFIRFITAMPQLKKSLLCFVPIPGPAAPPIPVLSHSLPTLPIP